LPSGDHDGEAVPAPSTTTAGACEPSSGTIAIRPPVSVRAENATRRPSGETVGALSVQPAQSPSAVKTGRRRVPSSGSTRWIAFWFTKTSGPSGPGVAALAGAASTRAASRLAKPIDRP
jgi:hypothetical protein